MNKSLSFFCLTVLIVNCVTNQPPTAPVSFAIRTEDGYYAIVKVNQIRISNKDIRAQAWFQPINGLRLLRH